MVIYFNKIVGKECLAAYKYIMKVKKVDALTRKFNRPDAYDFLEKYNGVALSEINTINKHSTDSMFAENQFMT